MIRVLGMVIGIFCTASVLTASLTLFYAWGQGNLTRESSREIIAVLKGEPLPSDLADQAEQDEEMSSYQQLEQKRLERILSISAREAELAILKQAINDQNISVANERDQLEQVKKSFEEELAKERNQITDEATAQARAILLKMEPESAVEKLLSLSDEDAVILMKGMPEKDAAKILDQFRQRTVGQDPQFRIEKAEKIYKAIYQGDPLIDSVANAQQAMADPPAANDE